jgi:hypothetical protein
VATVVGHGEDGALIVYAVETFPATGSRAPGYAPGATVRDFLASAAAGAYSAQGRVIDYDAEGDN